MDAVIAAAARALAAGDAFGALNHVALRDDAPALALRGIAMARLGDLARARALLRRAARAFGPRAAVARARCIVAEAEIALVSRDLGRPTAVLETARATLEHHGDRLNAAHARHIEVRRLLLVGRLDAAERALAALDPAPLSAALRTMHHLVVAGIAIRRLRTQRAQAALALATHAAHEAGIVALAAEVERAALALTLPAARLLAAGKERPLRLADVEALQDTAALLVDACRHVVRDPHGNVTLARRPVLFALARALGEAWPDDVSRAVLIARAFGARFTDDSHRARLRVEIARLRAVLGRMAAVTATRRGFSLAPLRVDTVLVLARPAEERHGAILALLADGEAWSSSALAVALGTGQRRVQRMLDALAAADKVQSFGRGRARRWVTPPLPGFATTLLLPLPPGDG